MFNTFDRADRESVEITRKLAEDAAKASGLSDGQAAKAARANTRVATGQERDRAVERSTIAEINRKARESRKSQGGEA
jgi:hypothetical protein